MKKPDNIVYEEELNEYTAYKKNYPTSFNSKNFEIEEIKDLKRISKHYFKQKINEIKNNYRSLIEEIEWNQRIYNAKCNFNPIIGQRYYLYRNKNKEFLSIINPSEWGKNCLGISTLDSNQVWKKIK